MRLLLVLCLWITYSAQNPDHPGIITVPAEGSTSLPCGSYTTSPITLVLKLQMEEHSNDSWVAVGMTPIILKLDTNVPSLLLTPSHKNSNYSCSVDNVTSNAYLIGRTDSELNNMAASESGDKEWISCHVTNNWTRLQWSRGDEVIAVVHRTEARLRVVVERNASSFSITSTIRTDAGNDSCFDELTIKKLNATCRWSALPNSATGWQLFLKERYWIIAVVALSCALFSSMLMGCFVSMKRRRRARKQAKSRFFKVSTATRNLYTDDLNQDPDVTLKDQDFTYQNVSVPPSKTVNDDFCSDKSSFLSVGGDSYLEPTPEGGDPVSDAGDCYESPTPDQDDSEGSLDGDCYENANEETKDGSIGSQSYEDMKGSICIRTKPEAPPDEGIIQDEDADSYENMQTPLYSQPNHAVHPPHKYTEDQAEGRKANLTDPATQPHPWKGPTELQEENGDFYVSYESNKL